MVRLSSGRIEYELRSLLEPEDKATQIDWSTYNHHHHHHHHHHQHPFVTKIIIDFLYIINEMLIEDYIISGFLKKIKEGAQPLYTYESLLTGVIDEEFNISSTIPLADFEYCKISYIYLWQPWRNIGIFNKKLKWIVITNCAVRSLGSGIAIWEKVLCNSGNYFRIFLFNYYILRQQNYFKKT